MFPAVTLQPSHQGNWPEIKVGLSQGSLCSGVIALLVCTRLSVPRSSLATVLSTTQLLPSLTHQPLPRAMGRSRVSHSCSAVWSCAVVHVPGQGSVAHFPTCCLSLVDSGCHSNMTHRGSGLCPSSNVNSTLASKAPSTAQPPPLILFISPFTAPLE